MGHILSGLEHCITEEMNQKLTAKYSADKQIWHIVGRDVSNFCLSILNEGMSLEPSNVRNIVLIPKTVQPTNLSNFRLISLCTILYNVISKTVQKKKRREREFGIENGYE
ncbi:reverse transcriptase [Gossypium australe]|uniref:Reverse transcriptase n=1 Tax=Gossypium australe TaxID=47621 RepID=A0A5B6X0Q1_9ROSI|nr:reverse transcriptase [Gossypium australe]